jgi:uridine kinase
VSCYPDAYACALPLSVLRPLSADVIIVEGILVLHIPALRERLNMKVYVDTGGGQARQSTDQEEVMKDPASVSRDSSVGKDLQVFQGTLLFLITVAYCRSGVS